MTLASDNAFPRVSLAKPGVWAIVLVLRYRPRAWTWGLRGTEPSGAPRPRKRLTIALGPLFLQWWSNR